MPQSLIRLSGQVVDIIGRRVFPAEVIVDRGFIRSINPTANAESQFILPGFVDAHVHVESSMLVPSEFARLAVAHGTVATVSDPHEIANVLGVAGVDYMIRNGGAVPFKFYFGAPSCVPATSFETAGAELNAAAVDELLQRKEVLYLAEMMNWPGVVNRDPEVMQKIDSARRWGKPVDGHAPGLTREQAERYIDAGILTDHECVALDEARHKISRGMSILIREGSAARNFDALIDLLPEHEDRVMFCSDDKHPDSLVDGHINELVRRAVARGKDVYSVLKAACINPVRHFGLEVGQLRVGDPADFIVVNDLASFQVRQTYVKGILVAEQGRTLMESVPVTRPNNFHGHPLEPARFKLPALSDHIRVMEAHDGQLITTSSVVRAHIENGMAAADVERDILKIAVVNRYSEAAPAVAFIRHFGIREGAIASSVAHDSHNIIVVGTDDTSMAIAVNAVIREKGGIAAVHEGKVTVLPLPVAGIMSDGDGYDVARRYQELDRLAKSMGSSLGSPFMTLSFMALLVIPSLKLSDKGLFDGTEFCLVPLFT
ncbi:MAG: adenine deaminase [Cyclobacteriaceae bacterium]|nr:adenine deaminase [Cyclobacteriaceae bacterium]